MLGRGPVVALSIGQTTCPLGDGETGEGNVGRLQGQPAELQRRAAHGVGQAGLHAFWNAQE